MPNCAKPVAFFQGARGHRPYASSVAELPRPFSSPGPRGMPLSDYMSSDATCTCAPALWRHLLAAHPRLLEGMWPTYNQAMAMALWLCITSQLAMIIRCTSSQLRAF